MSESFTIQISSNLVRHLADDGEKLKNKTKKPKPKTLKSPKQLSDDSETLKLAKWSFQPSSYLPVPTPLKTSNVELDAIWSVVMESEKVVERLQKQEKNMLHEVTQRAKDLKDKEFKLPNSSRTMPCLDEEDACFKCYKENAEVPLKCASLVKDFADCAHRVRQQLN